MRKTLISLILMPCALFSERFEISSYTFDAVLNRAHVSIDDLDDGKRYHYNIDAEDMWKRDPDDIMDFIIWNVPYYQDLIDNDCFRE